jgi:peptidoglycan hydrolase-like protein with peptidoglycan-binding domain
LTAAASTLAVLCAAAAICADPPAQTAPGAAAAKQAPSKSATKSATAKRRASKSAKKAAPPARPPVQQHPTTERYKEIQQALMDRGYFRGPVDGNWGPESESALQRFQHDQNLEEDGKIGSLSLIALGLGPRRAASPEPPKRPPEPPPEVEAK